MDYYKVFIFVEGKKKYTSTATTIKRPIRESDSENFSSSEDGGRRAYGQRSHKKWRKQSSLKVKKKKPKSEPLEVSDETESEFSEEEEGGMGRVKNEQVTFNIPFIPEIDSKNYLNY